MKKILTAGLLVIASAAPLSFADCVADLSVTDAQQAYQQGMNLEAQGQLWDAINKYDVAQGYVCEDGGNPVAKQALTKAIALGSKQGKLEEQKGNLFKDGKPAGAFQWYEKGSHFAAADKVLVAALKKAPTNMQLSAFAQEHFKVRAQDYFKANNKTAISMTGGYTLDPTFDPYVVSLPPTNIERLLNSYSTLLPDAYLQAFAKLEQQKDAIKPGDMMGAMSLQQASTQFQQQWKTDRVEDIRKAFDEAHSWTQQIRDYKEADVWRAKIDQARLAHADRISKSYSGTVKLVESALEFYRQLDKEEQISALEKKARNYADQAMAAAQYQRASDFYSLIGDYDKEEQARAKIEAQRDQMAKDAEMGSAAQIAEMQKMYSDPEKIQQLQKQAQEMQKQLEEQRKKGASAEYQKETDELEDELGL
ncbi:hypothetical protein [Cellvibrio sp. pealriver]|uniref:hypothetical protein n=1 Tax=Cellvibrio sp. pealriver TaxID=1622269 RepID=UPI00066FF526|nr:hypothetical protein [Cellvibrio sp. pealriver]